MEKNNQSDERMGSTRSCTNILLISIEWREIDHLLGRSEAENWKSKRSISIRRTARKKRTGEKNVDEGDSFEHGFSLISCLRVEEFQNALEV